MTEQVSANKLRIGFVGFGEAAQAFTKGWRSETALDGALDISAFDILFEAGAAAAEAKRRECEALDVRPMASARELAASADVILSAVTADQQIAAAESVLPALRPGANYLDINSVAPFRKEAAAKMIVAAGGQYTDVAVMAPVYPKRHKTPLLISGANVGHVGPMLERLGMSLTVISSVVGDASTTKMIRSVAIKGVESVIMECVTAAVALGIEKRILPSVASSLSNLDFREHMDHMLERVAVHGKRRAAEMREVAATLAHAGVSNLTSAATARHQQFIADMELKAAFKGEVPHDALAIAREVVARIQAGAKAAE